MAEPEGTPCGVFLTMPWPALRKKGRLFRAKMFQIYKTARMCSSYGGPDSRGDSHFEWRHSLTGRVKGHWKGLIWDLFKDFVSLTLVLSECGTVWRLGFHGSATELNCALLTFLLE